ncbi:MAG: response regulator transcription factor, partial [Campylobacteraceae bacterium]|nr:response regulator transcription factor [Campylobacteraceae bacterium]
MVVLLFESDVVLCNEINTQLLNKNYEVYIASDLEEAIDLLYFYRFDLLLFEITLSTIGIIDVLKEFRERGNRTPTIFISRLNDMEIFRSAYHAGCNDYIQTPYKLEELEIRINYIKKVFNLENKGSIIINDTMIFDISNYLIIKDNQKIPLPKKEAYILKYFLENKNETVLTDDLIINIWQYNNAPSVSTIRTYIMNLRKII